MDAPDRARSGVGDVEASVGTEGQAHGLVEPAVRGRLQAVTGVRRRLRRRAGVITARAGILAHDGEDLSVGGETTDDSARRLGEVDVTVRRHGEAAVLPRVGILL